MHGRLPPLNSLRAFAAIARHLSFKRASEELHVTPAALSHQVKGLEANLGVKLFHRGNRHISLTNAGKLIQSDIEEGFASFERALARLQTEKGNRVLVLSAGPAFAAKWLSPRLPRFIEQHPDIDLRVSANLNFSDFTADGVDVAIRFGSGDYPGLFVEPLMEETFLPLCRPALREGPNPIMRPEDLAHHTLIHDDSLATVKGAPTWATWLKRAGLARIDTTHGPRFNHANHALDAAREGGGVLFGRKILASEDILSRRLIAPFDLALKPGLGFFLVCPAGTENRAETQAFRNWIVSEVQAWTAQGNEPA